MYRTLKPKRSNRQTKALTNDNYPISVNWHSGGQPAVITFSDGKKSRGSCIRCSSPDCMYYSPEELKLPVFQDFPADKNNQVCPTSAISWPDDNISPVIDRELCIICGLCVNRCPVKAIHLTDNSAEINDLPNTHFQLKRTPINQELFKEMVVQFQSIPEYGIYLSEDDNKFNLLWEKLQRLILHQNSQFPNRLARNLLIATGIGTAMRRRGDTNIRMDLVIGPPGVGKGTGEVEFGLDILDLPRNLLDNVAVLVGRYEISKDDLIPLAICLALPNRRSEYWRVVKDIKKVLQVKINTMTIGGLILIIWNRSQIKIVTGDEFYIDEINSTLRPKFEGILGREIKLLTSGYPGLFEYEK